LIGMIHLPPLLEQPARWPLAAVERRAVEDALALADAGFDAVLLENFGDHPFYPDRVPPHTIAAMARVGVGVNRALEGIPLAGRPLLGVNVLRNDARAAIGLAAALDAAFVRVNVHSGAVVTDQGVIEGQAHQTCRYRDRLAPNCAIFADVQVKHGVPLAPRPIADEAADLWERARADALIVSGTATGAPTDPAQLAELRARLPSARLIVGSGVTPDRCGPLLASADALIVGTWLKRDGQVENPVDPARARRLVEAVAGARPE
jgi:membrane complex biogenesis BtpA family protein